MNRKAFIKNMGLAAGVVALGLGCSKEAEASGTATSVKTAVSTGKVAVVYFSWSGNTRFAAETIAKKAGAALFEIKAETPYNSDFNKCCDEAWRRPFARG